MDLKEAFLTASAAEKIAEITSETEKLQEEMDNITHQLCLLEQAESVDQPMGPAEVLAAVAGPARMLVSGSILLLNNPNLSFLNIWYKNTRHYKKRSGPFDFRFNFKCYI